MSANVRGCVQRLKDSSLAKCFSLFPFLSLLRLSCVRSIECLSDTTCTACGPLCWVLSHVELCVRACACVCVCGGEFERLVEVKLLSAAGRREHADERPLHHPNGIHKTLNQRRSHGFGWVKPKKETKLRKKERETEAAPPSQGDGTREARTHARTHTLRTH